MYIFVTCGHAKYFNGKRVENRPAILVTRIRKPRKKVKRLHSANRTASVHCEGQMSKAELYILSRPWIPALLWVVLYTSDYYLTLLGARLHEKQQIVLMKGGYELTPEYQNDIKTFRRFSPRFFVWLLYGFVILLLLGYIGFPTYGYGVAVGALIVTQLIAHVRHIDNICFFRSLLKPDPGMSGQLIMTAASSYARSSEQLAASAGMLLVLSAFTSSVILLGGACSVGLLAWQHRNLARKSKKAEAENSPDPAAVAGDGVSSHTDS